MKYGDRIRIKADIKLINNGDIMSLVRSFLLVLVIFIVPLNAQVKESTNQFKIDFFKVFDSSSGKTLELASAISEDDYGWRPTESVRSIQESLMHLAGTHYFLASRLGYAAPEGIELDEKSVKEKEEVLEILLKSIEHIRTTIEKIDDKEFYEKVQFFGGEETKQRVILQVSEHMAEHLGKLIVYARLKGVTPPWSK